MNKTLLFSVVVVLLIVAIPTLSTTFVNVQTDVSRVTETVFNDGFEDETVKWVCWKHMRDGNEVFIDTIKRSRETAFSGSYSLKVIGSNRTNDSVYFERSVVLGYPVEVGIRGKWRMADRHISEMVFWLENWSEDFEYISRIRYSWNTEKWEVSTQDGWAAINLTYPVISMMEKKSGGGAIWNSFHFVMDFQSLRWSKIFFNGYETLLPNEGQYVGHKSHAIGQVTWGMQIVTRSNVSTTQFFDDLELTVVKRA